MTKKPSAANNWNDTGQPDEDDARHTPGPWELSRDAVPEGHVQITVYAECDGRRVATAFEREANARLIAAAPDLLAACEGALAVLHNPMVSTVGLDEECYRGKAMVELRAALRVAIARAKGQAVQP